MGKSGYDTVNHGPSLVPPSLKKLIFLGIGILMALVLTFMFVNFETVQGNEVGVLETFTGGVDAKPYPAKTYVLFRPTQTMYKYPLNLQVFVMNDRTENQGEKGAGREHDAYLVQSSEGQDMHISMNVQWRIDPAKVVQIHNTVRTDIEEKLLRPVIMRVVKDQGTKRTAIEAYSGVGLVSLQNDIYADLMDAKHKLRENGCVVENFVIEHIRLDPKYILEITTRQVAMQKKLKEDEETKAANAAALRAEAEAQSDLKKQVVAAQRDKEVGILKAEQEAKMAVLGAEAAKQKTILAATAEKEKLVLEGTGKRDAAMLEAEGILALGKAKAEAQKLQLSAYAVPGADAFVKVEVAKAFATSTSGVQGYLPSDMHIFTLGKNFSQAVDMLVGKNQTPVIPAK